MAVITGTRYSDSDTSNIAIDMSNTLYMISPSDVPLLTLIGKDSLASPCVAVKHEWLESSLRPLDSLLTTSPNSSDTTAGVTSGQGKFFRAGDICKISAELVLVTSISTDTLTITRGYGGSTAAAHSTGDTISIVGTAILQDAAQGASRTTTKTGLFNYTQIYEDTLKATSTSEAIKKYVEQNELSAQLRDSLTVMWQTWERAVLHGRKVAPTSTTAGAMDGILVRLSTNTYAKSGAALVEEYIIQALSDCWTAGGHPDTLMSGSFQKRQINKFLDPQRIASQDDRSAGVTIDRYQSDFGNLQLVLNRNMPADTLLIFEKGRVGFGPLTAHAMSAAPVETSTRSTRAIQIWGQYTSETRNESAHAKITGLATS